jgi:AraC family transcriptional regulator
LKGGYVEQCGGRQWSCTPRTIFLRPPGEVHASRFGEAGGRLFGIDLGAEWPARMDAFGGTLHKPATLGGQCAGVFLRLYREFRSNDLASPLVIEGLVLELIGEACRCAAPHRESGLPRWLAQVRAALHERYCDPPSLAALAEEVHIHPVHLARVFRRRFGCTVGEYVRRLRIEFTCRELAQSDCSLVEIALAAGFCDQSQFCRAFKRQLGTTPAQFRRQLRER